jgi:hypothetical protein
VRSSALGAGVNPGRFEPCVAEQLGDDDEVGAAAHERGRERVPEDVDRRRGARRPAQCGAFRWSKSRVGAGSEPQCGAFRWSKSRVGAGSEVAARHARRWPAALPGNGPWSPHVQAIKSVAVDRDAMGPRSSAQLTCEWLAGGEARRGRPVGLPAPGRRAPGRRRNAGGGATKYENET